MDFLDAQKFADWHACAECGAILIIEMVSPGDYWIRCREKSHQGFVRVETLTERYDAGEAVPVEIANNIETRRRRNMERELGERDTRDLMPYHGITSLTKEQATKILQTVWPLAPAVEVYKAAVICSTYGLNPLMKHVFLIPYENKKTGETTWSAVLGIAASRLIAQRKARYSYLDGPRLMTSEEQTKILGDEDKGSWWAITILGDGQGNRAPGYGSFPKGEAVKGAGKGNTPQNMAFIRSERAALDRLCPGEMPGVEVIDGQFQEVGAHPAPSPAQVSSVPGGQEGKIPGHVDGARQKDKYTKFWGDVTAMGLRPLDVHQRLGVASLQDWEAEGKTLEEAVEVLRKQMEVRH